MLPRLCISLMFVSVMLSSAIAQEKDEKKKEEKKTESVTLKAAPLKVYESVDGVFESTRTHEIKTDFKNWTDLEVENVQPEGTRVTAGQDLLSFDKKSIEKALTEARFAAKSAELSFKDAQLAMQEIEMTMKLDEQLIESKWKNAQQDWDYYQKVTAPERLKDLLYDEESAGYGLEYAKDELDQLEQMYNEDELTEESEAIVLKRAQRSVKSAERRKHSSMLRIDRSRKYEIPRRNMTEEDSFARAKIEYEKAVASLSIKRQRTETALKKAEFANKNAQEKLAELEGDYKNMVLKAPSNGILYYGQCVRGKWTGATGGASRRIKPGQKLGANKVVLTIVDPTQMIVRGTVEEKQLSLLARGTAGRALLKGSGRQILPVAIMSISNVPMGEGKYDCQFEARDVDKAKLMPGMTCKISMETYSNDTALMAPEKSVFSDDGGISHYVYVADGDSDPVKTPVRVGHKSGDKVQILDGVSAGTKIAKSKPE